ncbi:MAG: hypothetical protein AB7G17_09155 [Phycisphaerales bacterium]
MPQRTQTRSLAHAALWSSPWIISLALHASLALTGLTLAYSRSSAGTRLTDSASIAVTPVADIPAPTPPIPTRADPAPTPISPLSSHVSLPDRAEHAPSSTWSEVRVAIAPPLPEPHHSTTHEPPQHITPPASAPEMFGARGDAQAQRIVYVLDASGSMVAALPTIARELDRSLDGLTGSQWFQVVVFSGRGVESPPELSRTLARATPDTKRAAGAWLRSLEPDRRGDAIDALERALKLRPDVIFLVVKGGLGDTHDAPPDRARKRAATLSRLERATRGAETSIKVIQFFDPDPSGLIEAIATTYGGGDALRFISRKDLGIE